MNGVNPVEYIADVLMRVQSHPASRIDELAAQLDSAETRAVGLSRSTANSNSANS